MQKLYCVYKHTSPSGRSYIGLTNNYKNRCRQHQKPNSKCKLFAKAILKHGWDQFTHEILFEGLERSEAVRLEQEMIAKFNTMAPSGYNLTSGGDSCTLSPIMIEKLRVRMRGNTYTKGRVQSEDERKRRSETLKGRKRPKEVGEKLSAILKGRKMSPEFKEKCRLRMLGRKLSVEAIERLRLLNTGRKHTEESRLKMSVSARNKPQVTSETRKRLSEAYHRRSEEEKAKTRELLRIINTGKKMSPEAIEKTRQANLGKKFTDETKRKMSESAKNRRVTPKEKAIADLRMRIKQATSILGDTRMRGVQAVRGKYTSKAKFCGKIKHLGTYKTPEEAALAYKDFVRSTLIEYQSKLDVLLAT